MTFSKKIISAAVLLTFSSAAFAAANTSSNIEINVTKDEYINITGTFAAGPLNTGVTHTVLLDDDQVDGGTHLLGDLGVQSNAPGDCTMLITSEHGYQLLLGDVVGGTPLHGAGTYSVTWSGATTPTFSTTNVTPVTVPACDAADAALTMNNPAVVSDEPGTYTDTLTITLVSP